MIINKTQTNNVQVTVREQSSLPNPVYYLFEFLNKSSSLNYYCIAQIDSVVLGFDKFIITDTTDPDAEAGEVDLPAGQYEYKIYQQESSTNLDPSLTTVALSGFAWVEQGSLDVVGTETEIPEFTVQKTNKVYGQG